MTTTSAFKKLHQQDEPLLLGNVWDVQSAKACEKLKVKAIGTSSAAVAATLGYNDGQFMSFDEYLFMIHQIRKSTTLPLSVDLEAGYADTEEKILENIKTLSAIGVAGINIEDSIVTSRGREILKVEDFATRLASITQKLRSGNTDIFVNVRCDSFLLNLPDALTDAIKRIAAYDEAGADGIFLPCITELDDIRKAADATRLPINVMCMPALPDFSKLKSAGVKRISMGNFVSGAIYKKMEELLGDIISKQSFSPLFLKN